MNYELRKSQVLLHEVLLDAQVVDDEALALEGVLAHVELQQVVDGVVLGDAHAVETHVVADELLELVGRNLAETFETRDLGIDAAAVEGFQTLLLGITIVGLLLVADAEQGRLQDVEVPRRMTSGKNWRKKVVISRRMCMPSTSASVAMTTFS